MKVTVIKKTEGWNVGDAIEVSDERAVELFNEGVIDKKPLEVIKPKEEVLKNVSTNQSKTKGAKRN